MSTRFKQWQAAPILHFSEIESTNIYAMQLINAEMALSGTTIRANQQKNGRGQRNKSWVDEAGKSLLISFIIKPEIPFQRMFELSATVAVAVVNTLRKLDQKLQPKIKWPNDIYLNDKKAAGILIENVIQGSEWKYAIIGVGINILQESFNENLPHATSLKMETGKNYDLSKLMTQLRYHVLKSCSEPLMTAELMNFYNQDLYKKNQKVTFNSKGKIWNALINQVNVDGSLLLTLENNTVIELKHGDAEWIIE